MQKSLILFTVSCPFLILFLLLPSRRYSTDGFRVLVALHRVTVSTEGTTQFIPLNWQTAYQQPYYFRQNVQKHFLFPLYAHTVYQISRLFNYQGNGVKPLQIGNAFFAALTIFLFALLLLTQSHPISTVIVATIGLGISTAFSAQGTNITEVIPATPWLLLSLLLLEKRKPFIAAIFLGISAAFYLLSLLVVPFLILLFFGCTPRRTLFSLLIAPPITTLFIYLTVLISAGNKNLQDLLTALFFLPEQGTFGGLKLANFISTPLGFISSIFPVLPENFSGIKTALATRNPPPLLLLTSIIIGILLLTLTLLPAVKKVQRTPGIALLITSLVTALFWDPYHQKIWLYGVIGFWLLLAHLHHSRLPIFLILFILIPLNINALIKNHQPNRKWQTAQKLAHFLLFEQHPANKKVVFGNWEPEFDYLTAFLPDTCLISMPDLILEIRRDSSRFHSTIDSIKLSCPATTVYFVNTFNRTKQQLEKLYVHRLKFPFILTWLENQRPFTQPLWQDSLTGTTLYHLAN
ncbi:MAG: hypothetical protein WHU95_03590 [candidate division WOR-3 bacterium]|nr:hypothetical protein [candidate division WOR-3 bacterium]MDH7518764.1 hypothetical protein [bacterium]